MYGTDYSLTEAAVSSLSKRLHTVGGGVETHQMFTLLIGFRIFS